MPWDRGSVARHFGAPTDQVGSVNDPRTFEEQGVKWNEKWIYRDPDEDGCDRIVLWYRYDLRGVFKLKPDGSAEAEKLPEGSVQAEPLPE